MENIVVPIPPLDSCATGYRFYQCSNGGFSGCCSIDPCDIKICPVESSPSSMTQAATKPSTTLVTSTTSTTTSAESSIVTTTTTKSGPVSTLASFTYVPPVTVTTASFLSGTSSSVAVVGSSPSSPADTATSSGRVNTSGAIIGGVVGGVLVLITVITAILFCSRMKTLSKHSHHDHEKWAFNESSSSGRGYGDSILDSYLSNDAGIITAGRTEYKKYATLSPPPLGYDYDYDNTTPANKLYQPPPCVFAETARVNSSSSSTCTRYFHIPNSSSPRFFKHGDGNPSAGSLNTSEASEEQASIAGGVSVPCSTRSVSGRSHVVDIMYVR